MASAPASSAIGRARWPGCRVRRRRDRGQRRPGPGPGDPADQQGCVRRPPVRPVISHGDLRIAHVDRVAPAVLGDAIQQPPQRGDPLGADRERDVLVVGGAGQRPGEVPGVGAQRHPPAGPRPLRQGRQRAAQQTRRGRARVIGARRPGQRPARSRSRPTPPRAAGPPAGPGGYRPRRASCGRRPRRRWHPGRS